MPRPLERSRRAAAKAETNWVGDIEQRFTNHRPSQAGSADLQDGRNEVQIKASTAFAPLVVWPQRTSVQQKSSAARQNFFAAEQQLFVVEQNSFRVKQRFFAVKQHSIPI
uniref:hypothetical protein n=1 Tax=Candidatus Electronema sp. TaxID=2698783 RepID=UPI004056B396